MPEMSDADLLADLGVEPVRNAKPSTTPREARAIAGFEDIQKFVEEHGRPPRHGEERDIFERLYAVRLDRLRAQPDCVALLSDMDHQGLLSSSEGAGTEEPAWMDDEVILATLGVEPEAKAGISKLRHVRSQAQRRAAEDVATRKLCSDFEAFRPILDAAKADIADGRRRTRPFELKAEIEPGRFFVVDGLTAYVAEAGEAYINASGDRERRLRVVFDNGTESDLLLRSLQRALTQDPSGRRVTEPEAGPLFDRKAEVKGDETGTIYVLRSLSDHPDVARSRDVIHKIGVTGGPVERRFANAPKDPTFLMAEVEVVATFILVDIKRTALENLLHRFFAPARLDITLQDRFGEAIRPREWFFAPLDAIREAVERIQDGTLHRHEYRPEQGRLVLTKLQ